MKNSKKFPGLNPGSPMTIKERGPPKSRKMFNIGLGLHLLWTLDNETIIDINFYVFTVKTL
jgi:hypothetical protein